MATMDIECGGFTFVSDFDSGNLARVELVPKKENANPPQPGKNSPIEEIPDFEFNIWTKPDCAGTEFENSNRTWFYFGIKGGSPYALVKLNIVNLNRQSKMYSQGMAPVFRIVPGRTHWDRIKEKPSYTVEDDVFILSFKYRTLENIRATTYFAFTYPFSYVELQNMLHSIDNRYKNQFGDFCTPVTPDEIYYHRECVCYSLEGRMIDLITISSCHNITSERETRLKHLFPMSDVPRPFRFIAKKVVFVSARVHPGETPSSFVLNGLLHLLLARDDPVAITLRKMYVFKLIPMLNPDGVSQGHYRTDTRGVNLNRMYLNPNLSLHPTVYAARSLIRYYHHGLEIEEDFQELMPAKLDVENNPMPNLDIEKLKSDATFKVSSLESLSSEKQEILLNNESKEVSDLNRISNIENKVSDLTLNELQTESSHNLFVTAVNSLEDLVNQNSSTSSSNNILQEKKDIFASIQESILNSMGNISASSSCNISVVAEGMPETPFIFKSIPSILDVCTAPLYASEMNDEPADSVSNNSNEAENTLPDNENFLDAEITCRNASSAEHSISSSSGAASADLSSQEEIIYKQPHQIVEELLKVNSVSDLVKTAANSPVNKNDRTVEDSGLFLYVDLHGHASKKGIFMYGNHFENVEDSIECMLLPKIMSLNSQNFHFTACNFTERNMYLRDRRDGMSREGSGRVAVLKTTGLVRSYTLECNYNTGRIVNALPTCVKESKTTITPSLLVPPKFTPQVFEEVGRALGISILDLTGSNPCSRIPHSEFHTLSGIREWLRLNCIPEQNFVPRVVQGQRQMRRQPITVQVGGMTMGVRPSSSKNRLTAKRDTNFARTRRLTPLTKSSESKIGTVKVSSSLCHADKKAKTGIENVIEDSERKENLSSFQVGSCSQSSSCVKVSKVFPEPKENIGPCSSQRCPATSKKLKSTQSSGGGVLKQVLAVRTKCAAVGALASGSKLNKGNIAAGRIQRIQTLGNVTVLRKGAPVSSPTNMRVAKFRRPSITKLSEEQSPNEVNPLEAATKVISDCKIGGDVRKAAAKSVDKIKCVKDDQTVIKQGPKRLKISSFKAENSSGIAPLSNVSCKQDGGVISKVKLKEIGVDKFYKERKLCKKLDSNSKHIALINKCESLNFSQDGEVIWNVKQEVQATSLDNPCDSSSTIRGKSLRRNNTAKSTSPISCQGTSSGSKVKHSTKSEKQGKGRAPHLSPIKTLQKKKSVDSGRKRGKVSLRSIATSVSRLRAPSSDASQSVQPEKKRKKLKSKLP